MRSTVHLTDRLTNAERRFGSADAYVPVRVKLEDGTEAVALMTDAPFLEGIARAQANPEDVERAEAIAELRAHQAAKAARATIRFRSVKIESTTHLQQSSARLVEVPRVIHVGARGHTD
jgi:hypothetical protein